jgi:RNA polymerase sigma factor (sigma-70 family)
MEEEEGTSDWGGRTMSDGTATLVRAIRTTIKPDWTRLDDRELLRRFAEEGSQEAFAVLVRRHAPLVFGACRRALPTAQDAEDACQATFLVLARKVRNHHWQSSLAGWLYATARKVAGNARQAERRRASREARTAIPEAVEPVDLVTGRELLDALDEELARLPPRYREPLLLCYLEGHSRDEVAGRLGLPPGTVKTRLERGRKKLAAALRRRGCAPDAGLLVLAATSPAEPSAPRLVEAVLDSVSGSPPPAVAALARGVGAGPLPNRLTLAVLALAAFIGVGVGAWNLTAAGQKAEKAAAPPATAERKPGEAKAAAPPRAAPLSGRVLSPEGKPLAGAELLLVRQGARARKVGVTGADGRFKIDLPQRQRGGVLLARAAGVGIDFIGLGQKPSGEIELRTVKDQVIRGLVISTEGKPLAGVTVALAQLSVFKNNSLDSFLAGWKAGSTNELSGTVKHLWDEGAFKATTGPDGRFTLAGTGVERLVALRLRKPGIVESQVWVVNRAGFDPKSYNRAASNPASRPFGMTWLLYGPELTFVAEPDKPIRGVVKDADSGKPRAGVLVRLNGHSATTDDRGRYEIRGARKAGSYTVEVDGDPSSGHVARRARAADTPGFGPITLDVPVKRGVVVTGRILDSKTRKPLRGWVMTTALVGNGHARDYPGFSPFGIGRGTASAADGTFRVVTIPGPVLLMAGVDTRGMPEGELGRYRYKLARPDPKHPRYFSLSVVHGGAFFALGGFEVPLQGNFARVLLLERGGAVKQDVVLERSGAPPVKMVDWGRLER